MQKNLEEIAEYILEHSSSPFYALEMTLSLYLLHKSNPSIAEKLCAGSVIDSIQLLTKALEERYGKKEYVINFNPKKIFREFGETPASTEDLGRMIDKFCIDKTIHRLYEYSTPYELKRLIKLLLRIQDGESLYSPCCGMGSVFEIASETDTYVHGEDINEDAIRIAELFLESLGIRHTLQLGNALKIEGLSKSKKSFDKVICFPPSNMRFFESDRKFEEFGNLPKNIPEIYFLLHSISVMEKCGVVLVNNEILKSNAKLAKTKEVLLKRGVIQAIIKLPSAIIPFSKRENSLLLLSKNNTKVTFFDASGEEYYQKEGKYNKLKNIDKIVSEVLGCKTTKNCTTRDMSDLHYLNLNPEYYLSDIPKNPSNVVLLKKYAERIYRGQRCEESVDGKYRYKSIGIGDFKQHSPTIPRGKTNTTNDENTVKKFALKEWDILIAMRTGPEKIAIVGDCGEIPILPNAGIIVVRTKNTKQAIALYMFLISIGGQEQLGRFFTNSPNKTLSPKILEDFVVPIFDTDKMMNNFKKLTENRAKIEKIEEMNKRIIDDI